MASTVAAGGAAPHYQLSHLDELEAESVHIIREVAATFERPGLLFSGGKDSVVMFHLARRAFWPAPVPFPLMHVDTGHNFDEVIDYRDRIVAETGVRLVVSSVQDDIDAGRVVEDTGPGASRNRLQTAALLRGITENRFDAVFGGARRDEEKARAKERVFSFRDEFGAWDPRAQRPELWRLYNGRHRKGEHIRVFPLSNWTELDIWQYIAAQDIELPSIYYAHQREVVPRDGMLLAKTRFLQTFPGEETITETVRFRTVGDATCTGCVESTADNVAAVIEEVAMTRLTERGATRADDRISESGMEDRKKEGYFLMTALSDETALATTGAEGQMLRLATAGSVDDGKSTLIGRLLFDSKSIFTDQMESIERTSAERGDEYANLALLTDGLRAEREQGITIDVAYRYFATPRRKFIIADTPGHVQYTRNMVTGASTADLALVLVDARKGVLEQTRRHAFLSSLLGIPHLTICVNKMDLVDWSEERFTEICDEFRGFAAKLNVTDLTFVPVSALRGDNVVDQSENMPWYTGRSLLGHLENVYIASDRNLIDARMPVQYVIRPQRSDGADHRAFAGTVAGGVFSRGDEVVVLPGGFSTTITDIWGPGGDKVDEAFASMAVSIELADEIDIVRGDMLARPNNRPYVGRDVDAMVCWFSEDTALTVDGRYQLMCGTRSTRAQITGLTYRLDVNSLHRDEEAESLQLNEIARLTLRTQVPLMFDSYRRNRETGSFILIDENTNKTVGAGMITAPVSRDSHVVWQSGKVTREQRSHQGATIWLTGLSGSGKSSVAAEIERRIVAEGKPAYLMDGDNLRHGLNSDLGFGDDDRRENIRRTSEVASLFADSGAVAIVSLISPFADERQRAREIHAERGLPFYEIFVDTPIEECERRDPKGLYAKARRGEISQFTGVDSPYQAPEKPDIVVTPADGTPAEMADAVLRDLGL